MPKRYREMDAKGRFQPLYIFLFCSLCVNIVLMGLLFYENIKYSISGTYICEGIENSDNLYLILKEDGSYQLYKQFQTISVGTYVNQKDNTYTLQGEEGNECLIVYNERDIIYYYAIKEGVKTYKRISKLPVYININ